jgi:acyl-CoA synthetase (AMP-forming)/AMP-acid ligase II
MELRHLITNELHLNYELDWIKRWAHYAPQKIALTDGDSGESMTYSKLYELSISGAALLKNKYQIKKGDRVIHFSTNEMNTFVLFFALSRLGATLVPINYRLTPRELSYVITNAEPQLIVYEQSFKGLLHEIKNDIQIPEEKWLPLVGENSFASQVLTETQKELGFDADPLSFILQARQVFRRVR